MSSWLCLRNCYTAEDKYYTAGVVYDLPDAMFKAEKNFRLVGSEVVEKPVGQVTTAPEVVEATPAPSEGVTGDSTEKPPLYISPNPRPKKKKRSKS